ncbi:unnamed protein product [Mycena citricolor]|uniref:Uncharacterized protein n=1 Tax=Mycena citricolor TaxID=2018698 RepID=A0AAD2HX51_9AGAR|nr:unnamed protein product [Mycena citricolor]
MRAGSISQVCHQQLKAEIILFQVRFQVGRPLEEWPMFSPPKPPVCRSAGTTISPSRTAILGLASRRLRNYLLKCGSQCHLGPSSCRRSEVYRGYFCWPDAVHSE